MKKILLIGIGGVYNYGCEAIVRGTVIIIHEFFPDAKVYYASYRRFDDKERLKNCDVEIIERPINRYSFKNVIRKLLSIIHIRINISHDSYPLIKGYDAVFSIGGDIYTLNSDNRLPYHLMKLGDLCKRKRIPYVLWGCSVGPFDQNKKALKDMKRHLKKVSLIVAREYNTIKYLNSIGIKDNVLFAPDPAFYVKGPFKVNSLNNQFNKIGINLSPLSLRYRSINELSAIEKQAKTIKDLIEVYKVNIVLIPHVICDFKITDDDYRYLLKLKNVLKEKYYYEVELLPKDLGFIGTKEELVKCDLVLAARMHCGISSVSSNIPTIFLSYSEKSIGMAMFIYGNTNYTFPIEKFSNILNQIDYKKIGSSIKFKIDIKADYKFAMSQIINKKILTKE